MAYSFTTATKKILELKKRIKIIQGGTSASKTISILLILIDKAQQKQEVNELTSIVSESIPHLKRGAMRDFKLIMQAHNYWKDANWNATDSIYTFESGNQIEFFSTDNGDKLRGARRDWLFINEANNNTFQAFEQLEVRTKKGIYLDYNPTNEFWVQTELKSKRTDIDFIILTYKDNEALAPEIVASLEQRMDRKDWWTVFGMGQEGILEGTIYKNWQIIDEVPHEARLEGYGLDFGYTNDPTAIVAIYYYNGGYILDEITFKKGLSNKQIADILSNHPSGLVIADSAEPKSIDEIASYDISIVGAQKGSDSIAHGISVVQAQRISMTKRSTNIIKEYRNFLFMTDKTGKVTNIPESGFDHSMDAIRYRLVPLVKTNTGDMELEQSDRLLNRLKNLTPQTR